MPDPSKFDVDMVFSKWRGVVPEAHISSKPEERDRFGEHGDYIDIQYFKNFISVFNTSEFIDVIVEARKREKAIAKLLEDMRGEKRDYINRARVCSL